jgi:hypothetical protein
MSERTFRIIQGLYILLALYFELDALIWAYLAVIAIEGITNWRIPRLINRLRSANLVTTTGSASLDEIAQSAADIQAVKTTHSAFNFEAERLLRVVVFVLLIFTVLIFPEPGWFFPWFIGAMLFMAGVTNICPMVLLFRYLGFR